MNCLSAVADDDASCVMMSYHDMVYVIVMNLLLIHDLLFLAIFTIESAVGKRLITHTCISHLACSRLSGHIEPHSPQLQS